MERILASILLVLSFMFVGNAEAASSRCEGCSDAQFRQRAIALGEGEHIIISLSTNTIRMYNVHDTSGGEPGVPVRIVATPAGVPSDIQAAFNDARHFYAMSDGSMRVGVTVHVNDLDGVPGLNGATAYDIMTNFNLKSQLGDRLTGPIPGWTGLEVSSEYIRQGIYGYLGISDASIEITVVGADGSTLVYKITRDSGTPEYQAGKSRTKNGQAIPESNSAAYQGTWSGVDQPALRNYLIDIGVPISYNGTGSGYGSMQCTWDGRTLRCRVQKK